VKHNPFFFDIHLNPMNHSQSASLPAIKGTKAISLDRTSAVKKNVIHLTNWVLFCLIAEIQSSTSMSDLFFSSFSCITFFY